MKNFWKWTNHGRTLAQLLFLGLTVWIMISMLKGVGGFTIEKYCPFGGVETFIPWLNETGTLCSLSTINITLMGGLIAATLVFKRTFCSYICPLGTVLEWTGKLGGKTLGGIRVPRRIDALLKWVKYPLLIVIIVFTVKAGELVFRDFDPYYVLFTAGKGHGISVIGLSVTGAVLVLGFIVPLSFCRYLCPLGAGLAPFCRAGAARIRRDEETCTDCGKCDEVCEWGVRVSDRKAVSSAECSNCLDCIRACPVPGTLNLGIGRIKK